MKLFALKLFLGTCFLSFAIFISELPHIRLFFEQTFGFSFSLWEIGWSVLAIVVTYYFLSFIINLIRARKLRFSTKLLLAINHNTEGWELVRVRISRDYIEILDKEIYGDVINKQRFEWILVNYSKGLMSYIGKNIRGNVVKHVRKYNKPDDLTLQVKSFSSVLSEL